MHLSGSGQKVLLKCERTEPKKNYVLSERMTLARSFFPLAIRWAERTLMGSEWPYVSIRTDLSCCVM